MANIFIADDHALFLDGLKALFKQHPEYKIVGTAANSDTIFTWFRSNSADVILLDIEMPPGKNGIATANALIEQYSDLKVIIVSMHNQFGKILEANEAGVHGYVLKNKGAEDLMEAIPAVLKGETFYSQEVSKILLNGLKSDSGGQIQHLSKREREVLRKLTEGLSGPQIADSLYISLSTYYTHLRNIKSKLGLKTDKELLKFALSNGFG